jgi:hypothetical protein
MNGNIDNYSQYNEFEGLINKFILQVFDLKWDDANKILKNALDLKKVNFLYKKAPQ